VETTLANADDIRAGITAVDGLRVLGDPTFHLMAIASDTAADDPIDVFALADALDRRGWHLDRQGPPDSLHATVSNSNVGVIGEFLEALRASADEVRGSTTDDRSTNYATME
jgi:glutamate/tyrosine decarboxylase-like PLP-dependent enzyme